MRSWIAISALALTACTAETSSPAVAERFEAVQGAGQSGVLGLPLDSLIRVRLLDDQGRPMPGVAVAWAVASGGGALTFATQVTDATGETQAQWRLGFGPDPQALRLSTPGVETFTVGAEAPAAEFTALAVGNSFACGLDVDGVAWCWGGNDGGTLGTDSVTWARIPVRVGDGTLRFVQLAAGDNHVCGRTATGAVWCWGHRYTAQLGDGMTGAGSSTPVQPTGLPAVTAIDAGDRGTCAIANDSALWCWGGVAGQATRLVPAHLFPGTGFRSIALGDNFGCGILTDSTVACWGDNAFGQLGQGTTSGTSATLLPISVPLTATTLDASSIGACAITTVRELFCWGEMYGMPGHLYSDAGRGTPTRSTQDSPASRLSLGYYCGAIWTSPSSPRLLCPQGWTRDIEALPAIVELQFGYATLCLRAVGGVTFCKNYSDQIDPDPFGVRGVAIRPAPGMAAP